MQGLVMNSRRLNDCKASYIEFTKTKGAYKLVGEEFTEGTVGVAFSCPQCLREGKPEHSVVLLFNGVDMKLKPHGRWSPAAPVNIASLTLNGEATFSTECGMKYASVHGGSVWWV